MKGLGIFSFFVTAMLLLGACGGVIPGPNSGMPPPCGGQTPCFLMRPTVGDQARAFEYYAKAAQSFGVLFPDDAHRDISQLTLARWLGRWRIGQEVVVVFYDSHLLGLAREMHCFKNNTGPKAFAVIDSCLVYNFGPLAGEAGYPDPTGALAQAISHLETGSPLPRSISAIDMYDPQSLVGGTDFFEFDGLGNITTTLLFDSEGPKFVPNACDTCHGGRRGPSYFDTGYFLPFIPSLYTFSSRAGYTLNDQLDKFSELNGFMPSYNRADYFLRTTSRQWLANGPEVPPGWKQAPGFFSNVLVPYCLGCHAALPTGTLQFFTQADFVANASRIRAAVCGQHTMPASAAAYFRFWSTGLQQLALNNVLPPPGPGEPTCQ